MAYVAADWAIDRVNGNIRYIGDDHGGASPSYATVIEAHRAWQALADDLTSSGNDELDITDTNPSARSTDNIITLLGDYNIDDTAAEHLYDGSITQGGGDVIYAGFVNFGNTAAINIIQNGAVLADDWWNSGGGLNSAPGISHRFMLKTRTGGADIDGKRIIATSRNFGFTYSEFSISSAGEGNNVIALSESADLNNATSAGTVAGWTGITISTVGYVGIDIDNNGSQEFYYNSWDINYPTNSINDFYEKGKWLQRKDSASTLYGISGELFRGITHELTLDARTGTFEAFEAVSWSNGTGQMFAIDSLTAGTKMWIQLLTGIAPVDNTVITGGSSSATATVNGSPTTRSLSFPFVGASTGSAIIGGYGIGIEVSDLTNNDKLFSLSNTQVSPPNYVTFTVGGLVSGEDTVQVAPWDGTTVDANGNPAINMTQFGLSTPLSTNNITSVVIDTTIPADTPTTGYIRVLDNNNFARRLHYSSRTGSTFTIDSTDGQEDFASVNASATNSVWISYIDQVASGTTASFTTIYNADRDLVVIVRDGGGTPIKEFISSATLSSGGGSVTAIRTTDA